MVENRELLGYTNDVNSACGYARTRHSPEVWKGYSVWWGEGDYDITHMEYVSPPPCRSESTGMSVGSLEGTSKNPCGDTGSPSVSGSRDVKSKNESIVARNMAQRESGSKGRLVRLASLHDFLRAKRW